MSLPPTWHEGPRPLTDSPLRALGSGGRRRAELSGGAVAAAGIDFAVSPTEAALPPNMKHTQRDRQFVRASSFHARAHQCFRLRGCLFDRRAPGSERGCAMRAVGREDLRWRASAAPDRHPRRRPVTMKAPSPGVRRFQESWRCLGSAADDVGVVGVQFKVDGANLGAEDAHRAVECRSWDTTHRRAAATTC